MKHEGRFKSDKVHQKVMDAQDTMLGGMNDRAKGTIFNYGTPTKLPITSGSESWMDFKATLVGYMVENKDYWENVRVAGSAISSDQKEAFAAPTTDRPDKEGKPESIGLELLHAQRLDLKMYEAEIKLRMFDDSSDFTKALAKGFKNASTNALAGATASIPYGGTLDDIGTQAINDIVKHVSSPNEIGSVGYALSERPAIMWKRDPNKYGHTWVGHKFLYFYNFDKDDREFEECYLILFRFELKSKEAVLGLPEAKLELEEEKDPKDGESDEKEEPKPKAKSKKTAKKAATKRAKRSRKPRR